MELWELIARERVRDTLALYNWSGDAGRIDDLAGTFCDDGELAIKGDDPRVGRPAIVAFLSAFTASVDEAVGNTPRIVRHNVTNVRFLEVTPELVRVDSYFTVMSEIGPDHLGRYRDELVPIGDRWLIRRRLVSTDWHAPDSKMRADARP